MTKILTQNTIYWAHVATIFFHLLLVGLIFWGLHVSNTTLILVANCIFAATTVLAIVPIVKYDYICLRQSYDTDEVRGCPY